MDLYHGTTKKKEAPNKLLGGSSQLFGPFIRGTTPVRGRKLTMVINHLLTGMILQVTLQLFFGAKKAEQTNPTLTQKGIVEDDFPFAHGMTDFVLSQKQTFFTPKRGECLSG